MSAISSFKNTENTHDLFRGKDFLKKFCESLRVDEIKMIDLKKKKKLLTKELQKSYENATMCCICQENLEKKYVKAKNYCKVNTEVI